MHTAAFSSSLLAPLSFSLSHFFCSRLLDSATLILSFFPPEITEHQKILLRLNLFLLLIPQNNFLKLLCFRIEKKRTIIPTLVNALQGKKSSDINLDYFYKLLFTRENLKLVHIVCHKKGAHNLTCDSHQVYRQVKRK